MGKVTIYKKAPFGEYEKVREIEDCFHFEINNLGLNIGYFVQDYTPNLGVTRETIPLKSFDGSKLSFSVEWGI